MRLKRLGVLNMTLAVVSVFAIGCAPSQSGVPAESHAGHQVPAPAAPETTSVVVRINDSPAPGPAPEGMVWIPGGTFWMGCDGCGMPDALPAHLVEVDGFWMDRTPVTNADFRAVRHGDWLRHRRRASTRRRAIFQACRKTCSCRGRRCSHPTSQPVPLDNPLQWWRYTPGASWKHPKGSTSSVRGNAPIIPLCTWRSKMCRRTRSGPANGCRPKPSSSSPRAEGSIGICIRGATS